MESLQRVLDSSDLLYSLEQIEQALCQLAKSLTDQFAHTDPILLCVMNGSVVTTGHLLPKLHFPLKLDYVHVTRYGDRTVGSSHIQWLHHPRSDLQGRTVIIIEDIFDEGITMHALRQYCRQAGVKQVSCLALIEKQHKNKIGLQPEFIGLTVPDRYVFGFGMDYKGYWRNAPGIYAIKEHKQ